MNPLQMEAITRLDTHNLLLRQLQCHLFQVKLQWQKRNLKNLTSRLKTTQTMGHFTFSHLWLKIEAIHRVIQLYHLFKKKYHKSMPQ